MKEAKKAKRTGPLASGLYTDTHCHLLPGVDDGVRDMEESLRCLAAARAEKIGRICVTPHIHPPRYSNGSAGLREAFETWRNRVANGGIRLELGAEVHYQPDLPERWDRGQLLPMGHAGKYLLVELPLTLLPAGIHEAFFQLRLRGIEPVLAHAERYPFAQRDPLRLGDLAEARIPFQLTTHSILGYFGAEVQRTAFALLELGWVALLASDAHASSGRVPMFREAVRALARRFGKEVARLLCIENPNRLLDGGPLLPVRCVRRRRIL